MNRNGGWRIFMIIVIILFLLMFGVWAGLSAARAETMYVSVEKGPLRGHSKPDLHSKVECRFNDQEPVNVLGMADGWAKLDYGGEAEFSYVSWDYLSGNEDGSNRQMVVSCNGPLRVRNNPAGKKVVGKLKNGDVVNVALFFDGWAKVNKGWVDEAYLIAPEEVTP